MRPTTLLEFQGNSNHDIVERLQIAIASAKERKVNLAHILLYGGPGCQPKGQKVLVEGMIWKNVEDVKVGDHIISPQLDGNNIIANVIETKKYVSDIYKVVVGKKRQGTVRKINYGEYRVAAEHLLVCKCRHCGSYHNVFARDFSKNNNSRKKCIKYGIFSSAIELPKKQYIISPYHIGIIIGDGGIISNVKIHNTDKEIINEIRKLAKIFNLHVNKYQTLTYHIASVRGKKNPILQELRNLHLFGCGCETKFIPKEYLQGSIQQRLDLLAGLIDTDGHKAQKDSSTYSYSTKSSQLSEDVQMLCRSLGFGVTVHRKRKSWTYLGIKKYGWYWVVRISPQQFLIPVKVEHKKATLRNMMWKNINVKSMFVTPENNREMVYGFTLDSSSGWYITNDWVITHNTGKTTLANIIANEMDSKCIVRTGGSITNQSDLFTVMHEIDLLQTGGKDVVLFFDEIHKLSVSGMSSEMFFSLLEDFIFYSSLAGKKIMIDGEEGVITSNAIKTSRPFTIIGATTAPGMLEKPLRDRFPIHCALKSYSKEDLKNIIKFNSEKENIKINDDAMLEIAKRARGTPRVAISYLRNCRDRAIYKHIEAIDELTVNEEMKLQGIQEDGLMELDLKVLQALAKNPKGLGIKTLAGICDIDKSTLEEMIFPWLSASEYVKTTSKRFITETGIERLNK